MNPFVRLRRALRSRILARALLVNLSAVSATILMVAAVFLWIQRVEFTGQLRSRAEALADFAVLESQFAMLVGDGISLQHVASSLLADEDVLFVVLAGTESPPVVVPRPGIAPGDITAGDLKRIGTASGPVSVIDVRRSVAAPERALADWDARRTSAAALGTVRIGFSMAKQDRMFVRTIGSASAVAVIAVIFIWALQYVQLRRLLGPITKLGDFARSVGEGNLAWRAAVTGEDEVASVARALNRMVERLGATMVSKSYVDNILQSMGESLIVVDGQGRIQTANQATCALLGYTEKELVGRDASELLGASGPERTYRDRNGTEIPVLFSEAELRGAGGGRVWAAQDITERNRVQEELRRAKEEAEEASRAKSLFLANMSHEFRTPLNAIIGYAELLDEIALDKGERQTCDDLRKIRGAGIHLRDLINDVLDISKMEAGRLRASPSDFELAAILEDVVNTVRPLADQNRNEIEVQLDWKTGLVHTDQTKFRQSLLNLMSNACKFTHDGKVSLQVAKELRSDGDWIRVDVKDTGFGIPPEKASKLFRAFYQGDDSLTRKYGGTGLGLAITKNLCELMGGSVEVESVPGRGSVFTIHLPARLPLSPDLLEN